MSRAGEEWIRQLGQQERLTAELIYLCGVRSPEGIQTQAFRAALKADGAFVLETPIDEFAVLLRNDGLMDTNFAFRPTPEHEDTAEVLAMRMKEVIHSLGVNEPVSVTLAACNQPPSAAEWLEQEADEIVGQVQEHVSQTLTTIQLVSIVGLAVVGLALYKGWL